MDVMIDEKVVEGRNESESYVRYLDGCIGTNNSNQMHSTDVRGTSSLYLGISHKKGFLSRGDRPGRSLESAESEREFLLGYDAAESLSYCVNMQTRERIAGFRMWHVELVEFSLSSLISCRTRQRVRYFMVPKPIKIESRFHAAVRRERDAIFLWHRDLLWTAGRVQKSIIAHYITHCTGNKKFRIRSGTVEITVVNATLSHW